MEELKQWEEYNKRIKRNRSYVLLHGKKSLIKKIFKDERNEDLNLDNPKTFIEKLNNNKLCNDKLLVQCADKYEVRKYVEEKIGKEYLVPQYFCKKHITEQDLLDLPNSFVLKTTSGSSTNKVIKDKSKENLNDICKLFKEYQKIKYGYLWGEFYYNKINNKIIAEKLLTTDNVDDYKIHCFRKGTDLKQIIEVIYETEEGRRKNLYDTNWKQLDYVFSMQSTPRVIKKPKKLKKLLELSKKLSEDFSYVRTDFYIVNDKIYFGELTFIPTAGYARFEPKDMDEVWGSYFDTKLIRNKS